MRRLCALPFLVAALIAAPAVIETATSQATQCRELEALMRRLPGLVVGPPRNTLFEAAWSGSGTRPACQVRAAGRWVDQYASVDSLFTWLRAAAWRENTVYSADGPDGTVYGFHRAGVTCILEGRWDGGDDSDSTYVPSDTLELLSTCATTLAADTTPPR